MINVTVALGANRSAALDEMKKVLDFEVNLFNVSIFVVYNFPKMILTL